MPVDKFLIGFADDSSGYQSNLKSWLLNDNAFSKLENAFVYRGRVRKRFGSVMMGRSQRNSRLRALVATTNGSGNQSFTVPGAVFAVGQMFSVGTELFTVYQTGAPVAMLSTGSGTGTYNTTTGEVEITNAAINTDIYFYPATPVMGFVNGIINNSSDGTTMAFDTQFSYKFDETTNAWLRLETGDSVWTGNDGDFFWSVNYQGTNDSVNYIWTTNFVQDDGIRYFDGTTWTKASLDYASGAEIITARVIVGFRNRLLLLNTVEDVSTTPTAFVNRLRYSWIGNPTDSEAFRADIPGKGGYLDAPTSESIVTAQFIKDRLIVYFESSTYELAYTGNQVLPFVWYKINTELGAESTFSEVPFDKVVLGVGNVGVHACNGNNVDRVDAKIPQLVFSFHNEDDGVERVAGIRDYYPEMVYWTYPSRVRNSSFYFPNKILTYNYVNQAWGINDDSYTAFGYFPYEEQSPGVTWGETDIHWEDNTNLWNFNADSSTNTKFKAVIAGNQEGFVNVIRFDVTRNAAALQVTNFTSSGAGMGTVTAINHNMSLGDYVLLENMNGLTFTDALGKSLPSIIGRINQDPYTSDTPNSFTIIALGQGNPVTGEAAITITGTYTGGGTIARVSNMNIFSKQYNFYTAQDRNVYVSKIDFLVDKTVNGAVTVDTFLSSSVVNTMRDGFIGGALLGDGTLQTSPYELVPMEQFQERLWHPLYFDADGECVQLQIYMTPQQMYNYDRVSDTMVTYTALQDFQLHAMTIYAQPTANRMQ